MANHYHQDSKKQHNLQTGYPSGPVEAFYPRNYNTTSDEPVHYNNHTVTDGPAYYSNYTTTPEDNPPAYYANPTPTTPSPSSSSLPKLIAIPATSSKLGSPFLRAYPPILLSHQIPQETFLSFIDHLNRVAVASPPVQVLGLAGNIVGMVPLHTAQIVGGAVNAAATLTTVAMSKGRVEMLLRQVNRDVFGPRGLCARIAKLEAVAEMSGMPILNAEGKVDKNSSILGPLESMDDQTSLNAQQRRINALSPWLSPLQIESLPAIEQQTNFFSKMHSTVSERQRTKEEKKILKDRNKMHEDWVEDSRKARADFEKDMQKLDREEEKLRYKGKDSGREMGKIQREREKVEEKYEKEMRKVEKDRRKDDKEEGLVRKILFLVIQPAQAVN